ncbi:MAG: cupin domain-containing protein [Anaerolineae bacterium]|nr:cupin domain-containing protein [Anaerolineae bacterium]
MTDYALITDLAAELPDIPPDSIISRTVHADTAVKVILFGFAAGQELSEHTASMPATLIFLRGEATVTLGDDVHQAVAGTWVHMPPHMPHSIMAQTQVVMLLLLLRNDGGADS